MQCASTKPRWRFSLRQICVGVALANVLFALVAWGGILGGLLFAEAVGIAVVAIGAVKSNRRCLVFGGPLVIVAGGILLSGSSVAVGVGHTRRPCAIEVVDQITGQAVTGAAVRIRDARHHGCPEGVPVQPTPADEPGISGPTDTKGRVTLPFEFQFTEKVGLFINEAHLYVADYFWIQVEADGYQREVVLLNSFTSRSYDYWQPLAKMTVRLKRSP